MANPVILVHGILGQRHAYWNLFRARLRGDGFRVQEAIIPWGLLGDLRIAASILKEKVEAVQRHSPGRVDLVCHSAGGLVARYFIMYLGGDKMVDTVVFMGTPHQGTYFSYSILWPFPVEIARQTRPGSHFLEEVNGPGAIPNGVRFFNLWSPVDLVVIPSHNSKLPGSKAIRMPFVSHWGFLWRRDVYEMVRDVLREDGKRQGGKRTSTGDDGEEE